MFVRAAKAKKGGDKAAVDLKGKPFSELIDSKEWDELKVFPVFLSRKIW